MADFRTLFSKRILVACAAASLLAAGPVGTATAENAGAYLAARSADQIGDFAEVIEFGSRALVDDPNNLPILEGVMVAHTALGDMDSALAIARRLIELQPRNQISNLLFLGEAVNQAEWARAQGLLDGTATFSPVVDALIRAWISLGKGQMSDALKIFDKVAENDGTRVFGLFQKALALAQVGDFESAAAIFESDFTPQQLNRAGILAFAQVLSQLDRQEDALALLADSAGEFVDPQVAGLIAQLQAGEVLEYTAIASPKDGIAELIFAVAESLAGDASPTVTLLYSRIAGYLKPGHEGAILLSAQMLEELEQHDLAVETFGQIPKDSHAYPQAALGRTDVLRRSDRLEEAVVELRALAEAFPDRLRFRVSLGDTLMEQERYGEARAAYDIAVDGFKAELPGQWATYFQRAIALSKLDDWPAAEADFLRALELNPEQPSVLNYLGYSYVERGEKLEEALDMIQRAVAARPDSGFIVDSLGWGLFRLGRYDDAVKHMERAVELMPVDPILNDHLGDTYWAVGRKREARFQWSRALSFITEDTDLTEVDPDRVRRKLEVGLDVVREEAGEAPLHPAE